MESRIPGPRSRDDAAVPSFHTAIADLRTILAVARPDLTANTRLLYLIAQVARAGKAQGMTPQALLVAFRTAWEHPDTHWTFRVNAESDADRHRAIDLLLDAFFAHPGSDLQARA